MGDMRNNPINSGTSAVWLPETTRCPSIIYFIWVSFKNDSIWNPDISATKIWRTLKKLLHYFEIRSWKSSPTQIIMVQWNGIFAKTHLCCSFRTICWNKFIFGTRYIALNANRLLVQFQTSTTTLGKFRVHCGQLQKFVQYISSIKYKYR